MARSDNNSVVWGQARSAEPQPLIQLGFVPMSTSEINGTDVSYREDVVPGTADGYQPTGYTECELGCQSPAVSQASGSYAWAGGEFVSGQLDPPMMSGEQQDSNDPGGPGGPGGPGDEPGIGMTWYPSASVVGQGTDLEIIRSRLSVDVPVWFTDTDAVMLTLNADEMHFSRDAILPDSQREFPTDLWNVGLGLKHMHQFENGWSSMLMFDIGSPSDKPFSEMRDMSYQLGGFIQIPASNERDSWTVGAIYSPNGSPNFPIPIFAYNWNPNDTLKMSIGLPFELTWTPTDEFSFNLSYTPLLNVNAIATYRFTEALQVYGGYKYMTDTYFLSDRVDKQELFYAIEQRLMVGVKYGIGEYLTADLSAGYAFGRQYGVGTDQLSLKDEVELESGAFLAGRLSWNF